MSSGAGVSVSGVINPAKVLGFLDFAGNWDPTLGLVMLGALVATGVQDVLVFFAAMVAGMGLFRVFTIFSGDRG